MTGYAFYTWGWKYYEILLTGISGHKCGLQHPSLQSGAPSPVGCFKHIL